MNGRAARWGCWHLLAFGCGQSGRNFGTAGNGGAAGTHSANGGTAGKVAPGAGGAGATVVGESGAAGQSEGGTAGEAGALGEPGGVPDESGGGRPGVSGSGGTSIDPCAGVACGAPDQCHEAGSCAPATGKCSYPNKKDESACGTNLECKAGACLCTRTSCPNGCCTAGGACAACAPTTIVTRMDAAQDLTVGGGQVYFLESSSLVYSLPTSGSGTPTMLSYPPPSATLTSIHLDGSYVYGGKIGNGTPAALARMSSVGGPFNDIAGSKTWEGTRLASNSLSIFAGSTLSSNYITVSPKDGSAASITLVSSPAVDYSHFAVDDAYLYFISGSSTTISRVPVAGGGATPVTSADSGETFNDLAVSGSNLVIASSKRVATVASAGGNAVTLDTGAAYVVRADATNAYYFRSKGMACASGSELYAMPVAGGNLRRLVIEPSTACVRSVVQDAAAVYWLAGSSIKKIAK